jgi:MFS family permease
VTQQDRRGVSLTIALAVLGVFVTYVPITAVSVSLTTIGEATGASTPDLQWVSDAYIIPMAATILSAGVFGDLYGRRRVYLLGMLLTVVGATTAGLSATLSGQDALRVLWTGQAITGAGGGLMLPTTLALIAHAVPDLRERGRYVALWSTGLVLGLALGPLVSGVLLEDLGWGWIFAPTALLAAVAGFLAALRLPESRAPEGRRLDWPGQITATIAIAASIYGVIEGGQAGWGAPQTVAGLAVGAVAMIAFLWAETRSSSPIPSSRCSARRRSAPPGSRLSSDCSRSSARCSCSRA